MNDLRLRLPNKERKIGTYKRNWAWETQADVFFEDGRCKVCDAQTDNKGRLNWIDLDGVRRYPIEFKRLGIAQISFSTPASWRP